MTAPTRRARRRAVAIGVSGVAALLALAAGAVAVQWMRGASAPPPAIFVARRILTLDPQRPLARAVAVRDGRIVAVGSLDEVRAVARGHGFALDRRFEHDVLLPGFIEPHLHPSLAATILPLEIVSAFEWNTPRGRTRAARGRDAFLERLRELDRERTDPESWLLVWGYHPPFHGRVARADLDRISSTRPIFVWHRSVHEMFFNTRALEVLGLHAEDFAKHPQADWEDGHLWERGAFSLGRPMLRVLAQPASYRRGLAMMSEVIHRGGLTTVAEQGFPQLSTIGELAMLHLELLDPATPYRMVLVPNAMFLMREKGDAAAAERAAARLRRASTDRIRIVDHAKYYADGAMFSQLMQLSEPYLDGHSGEWLMAPGEQAELLDAFWRRGWNLHVHVNGDAGVDVVLDQVEAQRRADPAHRPRVVLEHYGYARPDQHERVARLGLQVSNNPWYPIELSPAYEVAGLGPQRAARLSPLGSLARAGVPVSLHSDFPMAPAEPLALIEAAVTRVAIDGRVRAPDERLPLELALRAVTIEAARSLGLEDEIGSIRPGMRADFTVLARDPREVEPTQIREIPIRATVLGGRVHPLR